MPCRLSRHPLLRGRLKLEFDGSCRMGYRLNDQRKRSSGSVLVDESLLEKGGGG